jgi:hypothetical protein
MVQWYAAMSELAAKHDEYEGEGSVDVEFIVANPSSYMYFDNRRYKYNCGICECNRDNCTCSQDCEQPLTRDELLGVPNEAGVGSDWPCYDESYNSWPYGLDSLHVDEHSIPYAIKSGVDRAAWLYRERNVVYMVGENDTCNDALPTCDSSCWKRDDYEPMEWPCYRNHMDTRCPALLEGPYRRNRGIDYMKYLKAYYGTATHLLHIIPGVGNNTTGISGSDTELFNPYHSRVTFEVRGHTCFGIFLQFEG